MMRKFVDFNSQSMRSCEMTLGKLLIIIIIMIIIINVPSVLFGRAAGMDAVYDPVHK